MTGPRRRRYRYRGRSRYGSAWRNPAPARFRRESLTERVLILLVVAVVLGITIGLILPRVNGGVGRLTGRYTATGDAAQTLQNLTVDDHARPGRQYRRDAFGFKETDEDGNGCNVREDVLTRDLTDLRTTTPGGCKVASGRLQDPYTGRTIEFVRGPKTSSAVQIDHVVALENAWRSGASKWDTARRYRFGNDPYNLLAVDGPANQAKGSASADYWLPENKDYQCSYVARQIGVKDKYSLSVTSSEKQAMLAVLHTCPGQPLPQDR
ncbi:deoxyribonuclease [Bifidobacterium asteroides DSM 20089]|uniref:Deoxyribonuclease n=1 Tax=Bifidobacterium asteroides DSM 20089 TaxID=1437594 RepID=A0AAD0A8M7_9BIFI|nr:HNH endonuclease family protein [Bifidobacterium asteroides]AFU70967.1 hypothetical protein BAST_0373 [Bifidobacterium asteroides PRL2011]ATO40933.1 deoxyribonuclease [Bifidobacterium asteroides DSM 20089]